MIPRIIHQIWIQNNVNIRIAAGNSIDNVLEMENIPEDIKNIQIDVMSINRELDYILWSGKGIEDLIMEKYMRFHESYKKMRLIQKVDFAKVMIMHQYGGIYMDSDIVPLKKILHLLKEIPSKKAVVSQGAPLNFLEQAIINSIFEIGNGDINVNNGLFISERYHPFWLWTMDEMDKRVHDPKRGISEIGMMRAVTAALFGEQFDTMRSTGPSCITHLVNRRVALYDDVIILNHELFEPCLGADPFCSPGKDSYGHHLHKSKWICEGNLWHISKIYFLLKNPIIIAILVVIIIKMWYKL